MAATPSGIQGIAQYPARVEREMQVTLAEKRAAISCCVGTQTTITPKPALAHSPVHRARRHAQGQAGAKGIDRNGLLLDRLVQG